MWNFHALLLYLVSDTLYQAKLTCVNEFFSFDIKMLGCHAMSYYTPYQSMLVYSWLVDCKAYTHWKIQPPLQHNSEQEA